MGPPIPQPFDPAFIHTGCDAGVGYCDWQNGDTCSKGTGWYCLDDVNVSNLNSQFDFDAARIHHGCDSDTMGAHYSPIVGAWYCMDDSEFGEVNRAFIHPGCDAGADWCDENTQSCSKGSG